MDGISLVEAMKTGRTAESLTAYSESVNILSYGRPDIAASDEKTDKLYCLIRGDHKLIYHQLQPSQTELFNLKEDPQELRNLVSTEESQKNQLLRELKSLNSFSEIMPGMTETDLERLERLRSLGYTQ
jgi:hypothetical protein